MPAPWDALISELFDGLQRSAQIFNQMGLAQDVDRLPNVTPAARSDLETCLAELQDGLAKLQALGSTIPELEQFDSAFETGLIGRISGLEQLRQALDTRDLTLLRSARDVLVTSEGSLKTAEAMLGFR